MDQLVTGLAPPLFFALGMVLYEQVRYNSELCQTAGEAPNCEGCWWTENWSRNQKL